MWGWDRGFFPPESRSRAVQPARDSSKGRLWDGERRNAPAGLSPGPTLRFLSYAVVSFVRFFGKNSLSFPSLPPG